jgi:hypothetical protein
VVLVLGVLQHLLGLARAAQRMDRSLRRRDCTARDVRDSCRDSLRTGQPLTQLRSAAELLDASLELLGMILRLAQVLLEPLLVRRARGHADVRLKRGLELLLLAVSLVEVLDDLCVPCRRLVSHRSSSSSCVLA